MLKIGEEEKEAKKERGKDEVDLKEKKKEETEEDNEDLKEKKKE